MEQRHPYGNEGVLFQQLDDAAIPAAPAALHLTQLHPLPTVRCTSELFSDLIKYIP